MSFLLGGVMMLTCHDCDLKGVRYETWEELRKHRSVAHAELYVDGVPFWMLEQTLPARDYYWIARQIKDKPFLKWAGQYRG